ncbi:MAG: hypothetical protein OI717_00555 (plasmid) [Candidatus Methanoperedens sp.]|nr:MAG: hypothetical protein OI717_00555 [Candidatus Methanoperedens sp.]
MKKWILIPIIVLIIAVSISIQEVHNLNKQSACMNCHDLNHQDSSFLQRHLTISITCIDCHSGSGIKGYVNARKDLIDAILIEKSTPLLNIIIHNDSYNTNFFHLKANCTKCHSNVMSKYYNHTNLTDCNKCHAANGTIEFPKTGLLQKMETGSHRNKTCQDCHSFNFKIPKCIDCHKPHKDMVGWDNNVCLDCHNSPHVPVRNGIFNTGIAKENCGVCHENAYKMLTFYNSRHNEVNSCVTCHPAHNETIQCFACHITDHTSHPFAQKNCNACHGKSDCNDCHKDPRAPLFGLPRISTQEQFNYYLTFRL